MASTLIAICPSYKFDVGSCDACPTVNASMVTKTAAYHDTTRSQFGKLISRDNDDDGIGSEGYRRRCKSTAITCLYKEPFRFRWCAAGRESFDYLDTAVRTV